MIAGDLPRDDASALTGIFGKYSSAVSEIGSNWEGDSQNSIIPQTAQFIEEYSKPICSQLESLGQACDDFIQYKSDKERIDYLNGLLPKYESEWNDPDVVGKKTDPKEVRKEISECEERVERLKVSINSALDSAIAVSLEASAISSDSGVVPTVTSKANVGSFDTSIVNSAMQSVVDTAKANAPGKRSGECEKWAEIVWQNATGIPRENQIGAYQAWRNFGVSDSRDNIPVGAMVYGSGLGDAGAEYGHVGIYAGDGIVVDEAGEETLDEWLSWQTANCHGTVGYLGWGWQNNVDLTKMQ